MQDNFSSLFAFNRWANTKMLDACRKLSPEQYAAEPVPGWGSIRSTVYHIAIVTDGWLRTLADDPDQSFPTEAEVLTPDDAVPILERAYRTLDSILPTLTPDLLATPRKFSRRGRTAVLPPWVVLRHVVNHTTYHRGQVASKLKRFGIQQPNQGAQDYQDVGRKIDHRHGCRPALALGGTVHRNRCQFIVPLSSPRK